jgi:hypothetical protein
MELERRIPQGMMVSTTHGRSEVRPLETSAPAVLTSTFSSVTGYSWQKNVLDLSVPGVESPAIPETGDNAYTPDNNTSLTAGQAGLLVLDRQAQGYVFIPSSASPPPPSSCLTSYTRGLNSGIQLSGGGAFSPFYTLYDSLGYFGVTLGPGTYQISGQITLQGWYLFSYGGIPPGKAAFYLGTVPIGTNPEDGGLPLQQSIVTIARDVVISRGFYLYWFGQGTLPTATITVDGNQQVVGYVVPYPDAPFTNGGAGEFGANPGTAGYTTGLSGMAPYTMWTGLYVSGGNITVLALCQNGTVGPVARPTFTLSPSSGYTSSTINVTAAGTNTDWTLSTTFSIGGLTGASVVTNSVDVSAQTASLTITTSTSTGVGTVTDNTDIARAIFNALPPPAPPFELDFQYAQNSGYEPIVSGI